MWFIPTVTEKDLSPPSYPPHLLISVRVCLTYSGVSKRPTVEKRNEIYVLVGGKCWFYTPIHLCAPIPDVRDERRMRKREMIS